MDDVSVAPRCPACAKVLPAPNLERCLWCREELAGGPPQVDEEAYQGPGPLGSVPHEARAARRPAQPPWPVRAAAYYMKLLAVGVWVATALAVWRWLATADPVKYLQSQYVIGGLFLGFVVGVYIWRIAPQLLRGEPSARLKATVLFALHLLAVRPWVMILGGAGLFALHSGRGARWFARRRGELVEDEDDPPRPYWRKHGIDGT